MSQLDGEPIHGLPQELPEGEIILWQGGPRWWSLARSAFMVRLFVVYCAGLFLYDVVMTDASGLSAVFGAAIEVLPLTGLGLALLSFLAWAHARTTVYTITNRRVVLRYGIAFPMTVNLPFTAIRSAGLNLLKNGDGDIALETTGGGQIGYLFLWPHARPWRFAPPQPALRCVPDGEAVGQLLSRAVARAGGSVRQLTPDVSSVARDLTEAART